MRLVFALFFCLNTFGATFLDTAPIRFEPNPQLEGKSPVKWSARGAGYAFLFTDHQTLLKTRAGIVKLSFPGSTAAAPLQGEKPLNTRVNYFIGKQYASVQSFSRLRRSHLYPGIDLVYYGTGHDIEYDLEIAPGADPSKIRIRFDGARGIKTNDHGDIELETAAGIITQHKPVVYQRKPSGEIVAIESSYVLDKHHTARVALGDYDATRPLTVDPTITYQAYVTGESVDTVVSIGHDSSGNLYMAGSTYSLGFPTTSQAYQTSIAGPQNTWVMQLNPSAGGAAIQYCTYVGGQSRDIAKQMVVDPKGVVYVTGSTDSTNFPTSANAYSSSYTNNTHAFVYMLDTTQQGSAGLIYSTYFGGTNNDEGDAITFANGKIYIAGWTTSTDLPLGGTPYQMTLTGGNDAFVAEFDPTQSGGTSLVASTYLGGSLDDEIHSIAVDSKGLAYVAGTTGSYDFPITGNANQPGFGGIADAFLSVLDMNAGALVYSTYLGGSSVEDVKHILLTPSGSVALAGYTISPDFPVTANAYQNTIGGPGNAFISVINTNASPGQGLVYSTFFGGNGGEVAYDLRQDSAGRFYFAGYTLSPNLPVTSNALSTSSIGGSVDGFVAVLDTSKPYSTQLVYSSYLTGLGQQEIRALDLDASGKIYVTGTTTSDVFPNAIPPIQYALKQTIFVMVFTLQ
jgi:hypothetical protein